MVSTRKSHNIAIFLWIAWFCTILQPQAWPLIFPLYLTTFGQFSFSTHFYDIFCIDVMVILTRLQFSCKDNVSKQDHLQCYRKKAMNWSHHQKTQFLYCSFDKQIRFTSSLSFAFLFSTGLRLQLEFGRGCNQRQRFTNVDFGRHFYFIVPVLVVLDNNPFIKVKCHTILVAPGASWNDWVAFHLIGRCLTHFACWTS